MNRLTPFVLAASLATLVSCAPGTVQPRLDATVPPAAQAAKAVAPNSQIVKDAAEVASAVTTSPAPGVPSPVAKVAENPTDWTAWAALVVAAGAAVVTIQQRRQLQQQQGTTPSGK
jgi:hypothetical protein